jgi:hypothetical protein
LRSLVEEEGRFRRIATSIAGRSFRLFPPPRCSFYTSLAPSRVNLPHADDASAFFHTIGAREVHP